MEQEFLYRLLSSQGVSGRETEIQKIAAAKTLTSNEVGEFMMGVHQNAEN